MPVSALRERLGRLFFSNFFRLLVLTVSIAQWVCLLEVLRPFTGPWPAWVYVIGSLAVYFVNRFVIRLPQNTVGFWQRAGMRVYSAVAFTSIFGFLFLVLNAAVWALVGFLANGVSMAAGGPHAALAPLTWPAQQWTSTVGLIVITGLFAYGYTAGQHRLTITRQRLTLRRAAPALDGLRLVHISDIHIGRYMTPEVLAGFVDRVNALEPDIVVITGDIVDALDPIPAGFPVLAQIRARHGVFAILGNHDVYAGADEVTEALRRLTPFTVLRDDFATVEIDGSPLHVVGLDDLGRDWARGVRFHPALPHILARIPADGPVILLSHRPDVFPQAAAHGIELVLSGHTHGGQLSLPLPGRRPLSIARFITRYDRDLYEEGESWLYVSRGIGCTGQRIRLFTPRDIAVIEVAAAASRAAA